MQFSSEMRESYWSTLWIPLNNVLFLFIWHLHKKTQAAAQTVTVVQWQRRVNSDGNSECITSGLWKRWVVTPPSPPISCSLAGKKLISVCWAELLTSSCSVFITYTDIRVKINAPPPSVLACFSYLFVNIWKGPIQPAGGSNVMHRMGSNEAGNPDELELQVKFSELE